MSTLTEPLTRETVLTDFTAVVEELGRDFRYLTGPTGPKSCVYFDYPEDVWLSDWEPIPDLSDLTVAPPSCAVGRILARHGCTLEDIGSDNWNCGVNELIYSGYLSGLVDESTQSLLIHIQTAQDQGTPYGEILDGLVRS